MDQLVMYYELLIKHTEYHWVPWTVDQCLGGIHEVYGPNHPTPFAQSICGKNNNIYTRCINTNQFDILMTAIADVKKGQTNMLYRGEHQTLTKQLRTLLLAGVID